MTPHSPDETLLQSRLGEAADDTGRPLTTDLGDLLGRARKARRRDRFRTAGAAVAATAAVALAVPLGLAQLGSGTDGTRVTVSPAAVTTSAAQPTPTTTTAAAEPALTEAEVVARCRTQIEQFVVLVGWHSGPRSSYYVVHADRTKYRTGDIVAIGSKLDEPSRELTRLCLIPEQGHEGDPVPLSTFFPAAADTDRMLQLCSEMVEDVPPPGKPVVPVADLRGARIALQERTSRVIQLAVTRDDGEFYACTLSTIRHSPFAFVQRGPFPAGAELSKRYLNATLNAGGDGASATYFSFGSVPPTVAKIRIELRNGSSFTITPSEGMWVAAREMPGDPEDTRAVFLDANGKQILVEDFPPASERQTPVPLPGVTCGPNAGPHGC